VYVGCLSGVINDDDDDKGHSISYSFYLGNVIYEVLRVTSVNIHRLLSNLQHDLPMSLIMLHQTDVPSCSTIA